MTETTTTSSTAEDAVRNARKVREGVVVSNKMNKTIVISIVERVRHPRYSKFVARTKKLYAHDETNDAKSATAFASWKPAQCRSRSVGA